ncbi:hypothetical protein [Litoribacter populi]|uniref:hypothetical protein n=1 Tax=Litoribacter populi TaxID=2598460 RepID=UPI0011813A0C|nr:hypothetical protein [Litoribacter populi]
MRKIALLVILIISSIQFAPGQGLYSPGQPSDDGRFAASTKQVNQFFRRFNAEESQDGKKRYYSNDAEYRSTDLRKKFLDILFDNETSSIEAALKKEFVIDVIDEEQPKYLDFHQGEWFAEVQTTFKYQGKSENVTLFMKLQPEGLGYEWVIERVGFEPFQKYFDKDSGSKKQFLHPLSHELDFMNLRRAFQENPKPESYTPTDYEPDYLTLFLYEIKKGHFKFENVTDLKFHFFQIDNWYFELAQFNRPGFNTGWLISNLVKLQEGDEEAVLKYIYDQK